MINAHQVWKNPPFEIFLWSQFTVQLFLKILRKRLLWRNFSDKIVGGVSNYHIVSCTLLRIWIKNSMKSTYLLLINLTKYSSWYCAIASSWTSFNYIWYSVSTLETTIFCQIRQIFRCTFLCFWLTQKFELLWWVIGNMYI